MPLNAEKIGQTIASKMMRYHPKEVQQSLRKIHYSKKSPEDKLTDVMTLCQNHWNYVEKNVVSSLKRNINQENIRYDAEASCAWKLIASPLFPKQRDTNY